MLESGHLETAKLVANTDGNLGNILGRRIVVEIFHMCPVTYFLSRRF